MLLKMGVDISRLHRELRRILSVVDNIFSRNIGKEAVLTSTYEGTHSPGSLHYANQAIDLRRNLISTLNLQTIIHELKQQLGKDFDVVLEATHIHIEYDPKEAG